jgi:hypothetical protein
MMADKDYIYNDYLTDEAKFASAEQFWEKFFQEIAQHMSVQNRWRTFGSATTIMGNGDIWHPVYEAKEFNALSPIVRKLEPQYKRLLFITQIDARELRGSDADAPHGWVEAKIDRALWETGFTDGEIDVLEICTLLTNDVLVKIREILAIWLDPSRTVNQAANDINVALNQEQQL